MSINTSLLLAFLQRACCVSSLGEEGTGDCWGVPRPSKSVAVAACLLSLHSAEREGHCCWIVASRSHRGVFDVSASACGKLHLQVYRMWCLKTDWLREPGRAPARALTVWERQQQPRVCQRLEIKTGFLPKPPIQSLKCSHLPWRCRPPGLAQGLQGCVTPLVMLSVNTWRSHSSARGEGH